MPDAAQLNFSGLNGLSPSPTKKHKGPPTSLHTQILPSPPLASPLAAARQPDAPGSASSNSTEPATLLSGYASNPHQTVVHLLEIQKGAATATPIHLRVHPCLYNNFTPDVISSKHTTHCMLVELKANKSKRNLARHHAAGIEKARDQTFLPMIQNVLLQAESHVRLNSPIPLSSYKLNRSKILFVRALAIHVGSFGKPR